MPKRSDRDRVKTWQGRVEASNKVYRQWEDKYKCEKLYEYYLGHQWLPEQEDNYVINHFFANIETQLPSQLFYHPRFIVKARPSHSDDMASTAEDRAKLQQDTLNTIVTDPKFHFLSTIEESVLEKWWRFAVVEVGYTANFMDNPNALKPLLKENGEEMVDEEGQPVLQPEQVLKQEGLFIKYVPASTFRTSLRTSNRLSQCDWCGYYEWVYPEDVKRDRRYRNTKDLAASGKLRGQYAGDTASADEEMDAKRDMLMLWKIWDLRGKKKLVFTDGGEKFLLEEPLEEHDDGTPCVPFAVLKPTPKPGEFLPLPPSFNWKSPQDELNEARNMQKIYRRKLIPKFGAHESVEQVEIDKFLEPIISVVRLKNPDALWAIQMPPADAALMRSIPNTKDDLQLIGGTTSEQKGVSEAETATQANILDAHSRIRESRARNQMAGWLAEVGTLMLYFMRRYMVLPFWIRRNVDPFGPAAPEEMLMVAENWQKITSSDLGELSGDVTVDVESISPVSEAGERQDWLTAMGVIAQNPLILADDTLLRKTMGYFGVRSEKELASLRRMGAMLIMTQAAAAQQQAKPGGGEGGPAPGPTPTNPDIEGQLQQQMG